MTTLFDRSAHWITVTRESGDKPIYKESLLFHVIKVALNKQGHNLIKKCPGKDGHLTAAPFYLRTRSTKKVGAVMIHDPLYAVRDLAKQYREEGSIALRIESGEAAA